MFDNILARALFIAYTAHSGQYDKGGLPYVLHPIYLSTKFDDTSLKIVAILHDVIEDTNVTIENLIDWGFDQDIIDAIIAITHLDEESYKDYIGRIMENKMAIMVKIEDMKHNSDPSRVKDVSKIQKLIDKYKIWLPVLETKLGIHG